MFACSYKEPAARFTYSACMFTLCLVAFLTLMGLVTDGLDRHKANRTSVRHLSADPTIARLETLRREYQLEQNGFLRMTLASYIISVASTINRDSIPHDLGEFIDDLRSMQ